MEKTQVTYQDDGDWALDKPEKKEFEAIPEGMYDAVCIEIVPPTIRKDFHKNPQAQSRFVFATSEKNSHDEQFVVSSRWLPVKTHKKSNMGKLLRSWLKDEFPSDEALENGTFKMKAELEGRQCRVMVEHEKDDEGNTWVRLMAVKPNEGGTVVADGTYTRTTEREDAEEVVDVNKVLTEGEDPF